jgi:hypothetical protein
VADATNATDSTTKPLALGAVSGNAGTTIGTPSTEQNATPKPVFKMKRTGFATLPATLPQETPARARSSSSTPTPATSHGPYAEPEPAKIISDILPPQVPSTPVPDLSAAPPKAHSASDGTRRTKFTTDEERRRATSLALKRMFTHKALGCQGDRVDRLLNDMYSRAMGFWPYGPCP